MDYPLEHTVDDTPRIEIKRIKAGSLFKLVAAGVCSVFMPMILFCGLLALFGFQTVHMNSRAVTGFAGLFAAAIMAPVFFLIVTLIGWVMLYIGIRLCGYFKPFTVKYVPAKSPGKEPARV